MKKLLNSACEGWCLFWIVLITMQDLWASIMKIWTAILLQFLVSLVFVLTTERFGNINICLEYLTALLEVKLSLNLIPVEK